MPRRARPRTLDPVRLPCRLIEELVRRCGGNRVVSQRLGLSASAAQRWSDREMLPRHRLEQLRAMLRETSVASPDDA